MRSFLSRFTLSGVAALALAGLVAGCSGGTSSSLPSAPSGGGLPGSRIVINKKPVNISALGGIKMTRAQVNAAEAALKAARGTRSPNPASNGSGLPGILGLVTTSSPPGPYFGMTSNTAVYSDGSTGGPTPIQVFVYATGSGSIIPAQIFTFSEAPGGMCLIPFSYFSNATVFTFAFDGWGYLDECSVPTLGILFRITNAAGNIFAKTFVRPETGPEPPIVNQLAAFDSTGTNCPPFFVPCDVLAIQDQVNPPFLFDIVAIEFNAGAATVNDNFGAFLWTSQPEIIGPCPALPSDGLGILNIGLLTQGTSFVPTPLAQAMPGGTLTGYDPPNTNVLRCFHNDGTVSGHQYTVNNGSTFPNNFYNANGGQFVITSF